MTPEQIKQEVAQEWLRIRAREQEQMDERRERMERAVNRMSLRPAFPHVKTSALVLIVAAFYIGVSLLFSTYSFYLGMDLGREQAIEVLAGDLVDHCLEHPEMCGVEP